MTKPFLNVAFYDFTNPSIRFAYHSSSLQSSLITAVNRSFSVAHSDSDESSLLGTIECVPASSWT